MLEGPATPGGAPALPGHLAAVAAVADHLPGAVVVVDLDSRVLLWSAEAERLYGETAKRTFVTTVEGLEPADHTVASGVFNLRLDVDDDSWRDYVLETLATIAGLSRRGFAFNMLTSWSDPPKMRPELFYGDPGAFFAHCKTRHSRNVALLHDYGLYEWTMLVRADG